MRPAEYATALRQLDHQVRQILAPESRDLLGDVADQVDSSSMTGQPWSLSISADRPLRFKKSEADKRIRPDLFGRLTFSNGAWPFSEQNVILRVWSEEMTLSFRQIWDSLQVKETLLQRGTAGRVLTRIHFDRAPPEASEPRFHLQFGGQAEEDELSWHPPNLDLPRILTPPIDIILACEIVVAHFFPTFYETKREEPQWRALIRKAQSFDESYYQLCHDCCKPRSVIEETVLERLWNS